MQTIDKRVISHLVAVLVIRLPRSRPYRLVVVGGDFSQTRVSLVTSVKLLDRQLLQWNTVKLLLNAGSQINAGLLINAGVQRPMF